MEQCIILMLIVESNMEFIVRLNSGGTLTPRGKGNVVSHNGYRHDQCVARVNGTGNKDQGSASMLSCV